MCDIKADTLLLKAYIHRHDNKTCTHDYLFEPTMIWQVFSTLIVFEYKLDFLRIQNMVTGDEDINTHPKSIPKLVPNIENYIITTLLLLLYKNINSNSKPFHLHNQTRS